MFSEWIRSVGFWGLDFLRGSKIRKHYADIKNIMENGSSSEVSKIQEDHLKSVLRYASENVEFYKKFNDYDSIKSFPVINKNMIKNDYAAFQSRQYLGARVINMHTSGSTGTPFIVRQDRNKRDRAYADMIYFWGRAGYQVGMKYLFLRVWTALNRKNRLTAWARNIFMWDIRRQDDENWEKIRQILKADHKIKMLLGYGRTLETLANYLVACGNTLDQYNIQTIIGFGETFPRSAYENLGKVFKSKIISLYSDQEMGMLAVECVENKEYHVNGASFHIELLKMDSDDPASVGEQGRIVVTDLFNHAMPLIRYDTGDTGVWKQAPECGWVSQVLSSVQGATVDPLYDTRGNKIATATIGMNLWSFVELRQYQLIQEGARQYTFKLNGAEGHYEDATFVSLLKEYLGQDAEIKIEHVDEIPVLASGKRKTFVNNYYKTNA
jgi:phenylacetate-CoA ligase